MANNRLYLVDTETGEKCLLAKGWGCAWELWDADKLSHWLRGRIGDGGTDLIIGTENDDEFFDKWIKAREVKGP